MRETGIASFLLGGLSGALIVMVAQELWPADRGSDMREYAAVRDFASDWYVRPVDRRQLLENSLHGMLGQLDPYSRYYDKNEVEDLQHKTEGRFKGVGAIFRRPVEGGLVLYPLPDSPAARAGLRVGDQIKSLNGNPVDSMDEATFRGHLSEPEGGVVVARVLGLDGEDRSVEIEPDSVLDPSVRHVRIMDTERAIAYLAVTGFSQETIGEFDRAISFLEERGMRALILDLRQNLGGLLDPAVSIAQRFVCAGTIVSTEGRGDPIVHAADRDRCTLEGLPLVVLVDGDSASASEVLAGALQDHRVAVIVGAATYGKGVVQTIRRFDEFGTRAKITTSYYYSPSGRHFDRGAAPGREYGIRPDLAVPLVEDDRRRLSSFLRSYSPGPEVIPALEAWEQDRGEALIDPMPIDPQLQQALDLLAATTPSESAGK